MIIVIMIIIVWLCILLTLMCLGDWTGDILDTKQSIENQFLELLVYRGTCLN